MKMKQTKKLVDYSWALYGFMKEAKHVRTQLKRMIKLSQKELRAWETFMDRKYNSIQRFAMWVFRI